MDDTHTHTNRVRVCVREERGVQDQKSEGKHHLKSITHHHNNQQEHPLMWDGWFSKMTDPNTRTPSTDPPSGRLKLFYTHPYVHTVASYSTVQCTTVRYGEVSLPVSVSFLLSSVWRHHIILHCVTISDYSAFVYLLVRIRKSSKRDVVRTAIHCIT